MSFSSINTPIPGSRNPVMYINGLQVVNSTALQLILQPGSCSDQNNIIDMVISDAITINAANVGVNGLDVAGTLVASQVAYIFVIGSSSGFYAPAALVSVSFTPVLPYGYDSYRVVDQKIVNGAGTGFLLMYTSGHTSLRTWTFDAPFVLVSPTTGKNAWTSQQITFFPAVITDLPSNVYPINFLVSITPVASTGAGDIVYLRPTGSSSTGTTMLSGAVVSVAQTAMLTCVNGFNNSDLQSIDYKTTDTGDTVSISVSSWTFDLSVLANNI
jgi:NADH:ubiquinone oxidoreductase subunit K